MGFIEKNIYVLEKRYVIPIDYKMGSNAVPIVFNFQDYDIPEGSTAKYFAGKPSGKATYNTADISGNKVTIRPNTQTFSEPGKYYLHVKVTKGSTELITFNYPVMVEENPISGDIPESENQSDFIEAIVREYEVAKEELKVYSAEVKVATQQAQNATEDARAVTEQITKDSYLHTALETFINEVTATPTAYGNALVEKIEGYIRQNKTNGYQLINPEEIVIGGLEGSDGSEFVTQKRIRTGYVPVSEGKIYTLSGYGDYAIANRHTFNISKERIGDFISGVAIREQGAYIRVSFSKSSEEEFTSDELEMLKNKLIINEGAESLDYEPFTGGKPAPNPDYPQTIHGVGDMGFFDGELLNGYYKGTDGIYASVNNYVCNANKIPCNPNDKILIHTEDDVNYLYLLFYKADGTLISAIQGSESTLEQNAPNETAWFNFNIGVTGITSKTAKHITVTINGMYAVCVKTRSSNLFDASKIASKTKAGATVTNNGDGSFTISGSGELSTNFITSHTYNTSEAVKLLKLGFMRLGEMNRDTSPYFIFGLYTAAGAAKKVLTSTTTSEVEILQEDIDKLISKEYQLRTFFYGINGKKIIPGIVKPMVYQDGDGTWSPYQNNITYIPISSPLFEGDQHIKQNGEYKDIRKTKISVFDGSEDEDWKRNSTYGNFYLIIKEAIDGSYCVCDKLISYVYSGSFKEGITITGSKALSVILKDDTIKTVEDFKTWLQTNPITVAYELENPTIEKLSPEAQKAIHSIMACDELTNLEIVGVPSDAEVQNQFLLPRNVDGALNTTAYATAKRNEITIAEQESSLQSRLQAIEAQILQEV